MILEKMASDLDVTKGFLLGLARGASYEYKIYTIPKRSGGLRTIHHPSRRLKAAQRWLVANVIGHWNVHDAAAAYRRDRSTLDNASVHALSDYLMRMDFRSFFPSITETDIRNYLHDRSAISSNWDPVDVEVFCRLVCRNSVLTVGAPSSPSLSNALCYDLDVAISSLSAKNDVKYTRYADDLFFSTSRPDTLRALQKEVEVTISTLQMPQNLRINSEKTRHSSKKGLRRVTGIVLGSDGKTYVGRSVKRKIRAQIFRFSSLDERSRASLAGLIAYAKGVDPDFINSLISKYGLPTVRQAMTPP